MIDWRGSSADPTDTNGLPFHNTALGKAEYLPFDTFPLEGDELPKGKDGWVVSMEEINSAPRAVIAACYKLLYDRMVGNRKLHPAVMIICCGNLATDGAIVNPMGTAVQSRVINLVLGVDTEETQQFMIRDGFDPRIIAFAHFRPNLIYKFNPKHQDFTFACIRTWKFVDTMIQGVDELATLRPSICGTVSEGIGHEFIIFTELFHKMPNLDAIVANPSGANIPVGADIIFALVTAAVEHTDEFNLGDWCTFIDRLPIEHKLLYVRMLFIRDADLALDVRTTPLIKQVEELI